MCRFLFELWNSEALDVFFGYVANRVVHHVLQLDIQDGARVIILVGPVEPDGDRSFTPGFQIFLNEMKKGGVEKKEKMSQEELSERALHLASEKKAFILKQTAWMQRSGRKFSKFWKEHQEEKRRRKEERKEGNLGGRKETWVVGAGDADDDDDPT